MTLSPVLRVGSAVDTLLAGEGALARAEAPGVVLLHSSLRLLPDHERRLVLLHELAHLEQLARPGGDPARLLEEEAWEAAHARLAGRPFRVRGRARRPLNAVAVVQGGEKGHPHAPLWYRTSPVEPVGNKSSVTVEGVALLEKITLEGILDAVLASKSDEIVVVCHGSGDGLAIPVLPGARSGSVQEVVQSLAIDQPGEENVDGMKLKTPAISDAKAAQVAMLSEAQVKALRAKMNAVRAMKLKHVAFRACNMGIRTETMKAFRSFFGAASVSAPKEFDAYGDFSPSIGEQLDDWVKSKRKAGFQISVEGSVAFGTRATDNATVFDIVARATTKDAFRAWVNKHVAEGAWGTKGVVFHGVKVLHPLGTNAASVLFVRDAGFVAGLVHVSG